MADVADVFGFRSLPPSSRTSIQGLQGLVNIPMPGDPDTGGIIGAIVDLFGTVIGGSTPVLPQLPPAPRGTPPLLPGRIPPGPVAGQVAALNGCAPNPCCSGQHLDKATGTKCVSNRRMNPLNPRALRRAIRRAKGFERFVVRNRKSLRSLAKI